jgi:hypothetical protein
MDIALTKIAQLDPSSRRSRARSGKTRACRLQETEVGWRGAISDRGGLGKIAHDGAEKIAR